MSESIVKHSVPTFHVDRCINPLNVNGHIGKSLRKVSKKFLLDYPDTPDTAMICSSCRKLYSSVNFNLSNNSLNEQSQEENEIPQNKRVRLSREAELVTKLTNYEK